MKDKKWIENQSCYYNENYLIAEGHCDRQAKLIYRGGYVCKKCFVAERKHNLLDIALFSIVPGFLLLSSVVILNFPMKWLAIFPFLIAVVYILISFRDAVSFFEHPHQADKWNSFQCLQCSKIFLNKDTKLFVRHLKKEHLEEWKEVKNQLQQIPSNKQIVKIELPCILKKHKRKFSEK